MILVILLQIGSFLKFIQILFISGIKFIVAPPVSIEMGFSWFQTILFTTVGGIIGVIVSYYLSEMLLKLFMIFYKSTKAFFTQVKSRESIQRVLVSDNRPAKRNFTRKNKFIAKTKIRFGLFGIAAITPVILSIPLGTFLANRYYSNKKKVFFALSVSVACWSLIVSSIYFLF